MTLQIIGTKQSSETRKAIRFCKERSVTYQFIDLNERDLSPGELSSILRFVDPEDLIDTGSKFYSKNGYAYLDYDPIEELMEHHELMVVPIIRTAAAVVVGYDPAALEQAVQDA
ncbi:MAG: hypothetical protein K9M84_09165 [Spirochaetia bacterium]|nr:hypothetical protein [Spirochaetia bacterium]MCF7941770.1 hypothetical protein [Spirochaetia bacterium]